MKSEAFTLKDNPQSVRLNLIPLERQFETVPLEILSRQTKKQHQQNSKEITTDRLACRVDLTTYVVLSALDNQERLANLVFIIMYLFIWITLPVVSHLRCRDIGHAPECTPSLTNLNGRS